MRSPFRHLIPMLIPKSPSFDIGMPGALTVAQVEALDLDHWLLFFRKNLVHMEVGLLFPWLFQQGFIGC